MEGFLQTNLDGWRGGIEDSFAGSEMCAVPAGRRHHQAEWVKGMARDAVMFALRQPGPRNLALGGQRGGARIVATGRSDYNQVNNSLVFPGIFRGVLDIAGTGHYRWMAIAAAHELARCARSVASTRTVLPTMEGGIVPMRLVVPPRSAGTGTQHAWSVRAIRFTFWRSQGACGGMKPCAIVAETHRTIGEAFRMNLWAQHRPWWVVNVEGLGTKQSGGGFRERPSRREALGVSGFPLRTCGPAHHPAPRPRYPVSVPLTEPLRSLLRYALGSAAVKLLIQCYADPRHNRTLAL